MLRFQTFLNILEKSHLLISYRALLDKYNNKPFVDWTISEKHFKSIDISRDNWEKPIFFHISDSFIEYKIGK